jgi:hypothetical protein
MLVDGTGPPEQTTRKLLAEKWNRKDPQEIFLTACAPPSHIDFANLHVQPQTYDQSLK